MPPRDGARDGSARTLTGMALPVTRMDDGTAPGSLPAGPAARALRTDVGTLGAVERTPQGGIRVPANVARTGIQTYSDGTRTWREYRPAAEVFKADSLKTLRDAPVTDLHPPKLVTPETFTTVARGHASDPAHDDRFVQSVLTIQAGELVAKIDAGERRDVSAGYTCDVDPTPGVFEGQPYDGVQRNIVFNHVAVLPPGAGRAGRDVALRLDGAAFQVIDAPPGAGAEGMKRFKFRGRWYKVDADGAMTPEDGGTAPEGTPQTLQEAFEAAEAALMEAHKALATAKAELAVKSATKEATGDGKAVTEDEVPEDVQDAIAVKRAKLHADARSILGATAELPKTAKEIYAAVIKARRPSFKCDGKDVTVETLRTVFETIVETAATGAPATKRNDALGALNVDLHATAAEQARADGDDPVEAARRRHDEKIRRRSQGLAEKAS